MTAKSIAKPTAPPSPAPVRQCKDCGHEMPISRTNCPHCARPQYFPNVDLATTALELEKLEKSNKAAHDAAKNSGCTAEATNFESCCKRTAAVFACKVQKLYREVASGTDIYETYSDLEKLRLTATPAGRFDWARLRPQAEIELLGSPEHLDKIHYACLTLDGDGLTQYGDCFVQLAEPMIAHRASCFAGNTAIVFAQQHNFVSILRSSWADRHRICLASFQALLASGMTESQFPTVLVASGAKPEDDRFIEVHIFGAMTARTFESVRIHSSDKLSSQEKVLLAAATEKLESVGVTVTTVGSV